MSLVLHWAAAAVVAAYGLYALIKNQIPAYLFLTSSYVFFDFERPMVLFFTEYGAMMVLFAFLAHYGRKGLRAIRNQDSAR